MDNQKIILNINQINPHLRTINLLQCKPGLDTGPRKLYNYYFLYVHSGKGRIEIDGTWHSAMPGDLYFCSPGVSNTIIADVENPFLLSGIDFDFTYNHIDTKRIMSINASNWNPEYVMEYVEFADFTGFPEKIALPDDRSLRDLILEMARHIYIKKRYYEQYIDGLFKAFIIMTIQRVISNDLGGGKGDVGELIVSYLSSNYMKEVSNEILGKMFHYHPDHISRIIYSHTGLTLHRYIIDLRIRGAIDLLLNSDLNISEIAVKVGYENIQYFSRLFKLKTGHSPCYLRKGRF